MKQFIKYSLMLVTIAVITISCSSQPSLQKYYVDSREDINFIAFDIPLSILKLKNEDVSDEVKETLKTIKKVNILGFQLKDDNKTEYAAEKVKVKAILKNPKFQELIRVGSGGKSLSVKFLGEGDAIDEIIFYGSDNELGFALVRVLGDGMNPSKMMTLMQEIQVDDENGSFKQLESLLKNIK
ncbi:MAG: DUF4252 domain-containing protein [Flavobacteriaceae bacterium]